MILIPSASGKMVAKTLAAIDAFIFSFYPYNGSIATYCH